MKLLRCWACNAVTANVRMEAHHIGGKDVSDVTVQLCVICHDLVDRLDARVPEVFSEFSFLSLPKDRRLRLFLLKLMHGYGLTLTHNIDRQLLICACNAYSIAHSNKMKGVHQELRRQGKTAGRKRILWDVQKAKTLYAEGKGWRVISKEVGVSYQTVRRELRAYPGGALRL